MESNPSPSSRRRVDVFCLTYGEPAEARWRPQYEYSLSILNRLTRRVAPIPKFVTPLLAARRGRIRVRTMIEENFRSPLEEHSRAQVNALQEALRRRDPATDYRVHLVYEFRPPYIWTHLEKLTGDPPDEIVMLPLYVAESDFTSGVSRTDLENFHRRNPAHGLPAPRYVEGFGFDERFGRVMADFVWQYCLAQGWTEEKTRDAVLIMGAHGTLVYPPAGVNSGWKETCHLYGMIRKHLKDRFASVRVGWLNHTLGGKWTFPEVRESAAESQASGIRKVVYFPFGFMADNGESMLEGKGHLAEFEWEEMLYLPCPNADASFVEHLADRVEESLTSSREDWETIGRGRQDLVRKERPAIRGEAGPLRYGSRTLAIAACAFWMLIGAWLTARGVHSALEIESALGFLAASLFGIAAGWYKGTRVLGRMAKRNIARLRGMPQPSPLLRVFSKPTWIIIAFFASLGVVLRLLPMAAGVRAGILLAVGLAMIVGAVYYLTNLERAVPEKILEMPPRREPMQPRAA